MTSKAVPRPGHWVRVNLPDGRGPAMVTTKFEGGRKLVIVKPIRRR